MVHLALCEEVSNISFFQEPFEKFKEHPSIGSRFFILTLEQQWQVAWPGNLLNLLNVHVPSIRIVCSKAWAQVFNFVFIIVVDELPHYFFGNVAADIFPVHSGYALPILPLSTFLLFFDLVNDLLNSERSLFFGLTSSTSSTPRTPCAFFSYEERKLFLVLYGRVEVDIHKRVAIFRKILK